MNSIALLENFLSHNALKGLCRCCCLLWTFQVFGLCIMVSSLCFHGVPMWVNMYISASACVSWAFFLALFLLLTCIVLFEFVCLFFVVF